MAMGQFLREIGPNSSEVYKFKGRAQLRGPGENETFCPRLSHVANDSLLRSLVGGYRWGS